MGKRGKLIVIDGIDGSGKTLQTGILLDRLDRDGYDSETLDFPQYDNNFFGKLVGRYLNGEFGTAGEVHPVLASCLYAFDRRESSPRIREWLEKGKVVVMNRYVSANMGHQGGKLRGKEREEFLEFLDEMEYRVLKIPRPDLNILLKLNPETAQKLVDRKKRRSYTQERRDIHERDMRHLENTLECFLEIAENNPETWKVVDCNSEEGILSPEEIHEGVWGYVWKVLTK